MLKIITSPWRWWQQRQAAKQAAKRTEEEELEVARRISDSVAYIARKWTAEYERAQQIHDAVDQALRYRGRP